MNNRFRQLYGEICGKPQISYERLQQVTQELRTMGDISNDLFEAVNEQFNQNDWGAVVRLFGIMYYSPNKQFTPILCEMLDNHKKEGIAENVVDVLDAINDERSIPALARSLEYYEPGDDDRHLNRKIIYALSQIGTPQAIDAIKLGLDSQEEIIRDTARKELLRIGS